MAANKAEVANKEIVETLKDKYSDVICTSTVTDIGIDNLKEALVKILDREEAERSLIGDLVPYGGTVVLVVPIDSEAPKGRLILPQVQVIRDCLDNGIKSYVVRDTELEDALKDLKNVDLGRVKIPKLLEKFVGGKLNFNYRVGHDFPDDIEKYDLIIHCGACMINRKTVLNRVNLCNEKNISITNYGVVLAFLTGILDRSIENLIEKEL